MTPASWPPVAPATSGAGAPLWEEGTWEGLPPLAGDVTADVCVIGLGGSGLVCVLELLAAGVRVAAVDAVGVGGGAGGRNGGFLLAGIADFHHDAVLRYGRERAARWYRLTLDELAHIERETPAAVSRRGSLRIAADAGEREDARRHLAALAADGFPGEWYAGPEGEGILIPGDGVFHPMQRAHLLARRALDEGALLFERSPVTALAGDLVETAEGRIHCRQVVVAVDGRLEVILPELEERVRSARLQMLATAPATDVRWPLPVYTRFAWDYWQQLDDGRIALGGCRDVGGDEEWSREAITTPVVQTALDERLRERVGTAAPVTHRWAALVSFTNDGLPVMEEVRPGVWAIGGYCGTGNVVGALCGRQVARLALGTSRERVFA